jgi:hypothetical protein
MKMLRPDAKGRISLGTLAKGNSSFSMHQERDGKIILEPFVEIPANEKWLFDNTSALTKVRKGLEQVKKATSLIKVIFLNLLRKKLSNV